MHEEQEEIAIEVQEEIAIEEQGEIAIEEQGEIAIRFYCKNYVMQLTSRRYIVRF